MRQKLVFINTETSDVLLQQSQQMSCRRILYENLICLCLKCIYIKARHEHVYERTGWGRGRSDQALSVVWQKYKFWFSKMGQS